MTVELEGIRRFVGDVQEEQLRYVDCFVGGDMAMFMPQGGACFYAITMHTHPSCMFVLPFNDQTSIKFEDGRTVSAVPGKILALSAGVPHQELPSDSPPRYIALLIDEEFFHRQLAEYGGNKGVALHGDYYDYSPELLPLIKKFMLEADNRMPGTDSVLHALGIEICHSIIRGIFDFKSRSDKISSRMEIDRAVEYLHSNLGQKITVGDMAKAANMSASHFSRVFKEEVGMPPLEYLNDVRFKRVKKLLLAGEKSITQIALECGFGNPSYLSERFYKHYRITPSDYRKGLISQKNDRISKDRSSPAAR